MHVFNAFTDQYIIFQDVYTLLLQGHSAHPLFQKPSKSSLMFRMMMQVSIAKQLKSILGIEDSTKLGFLVHVSIC